MAKGQRERVLEALQAHPEGLSTAYLKRTLGITEANGRISELRAMGHDIQPIGKDEHGFDIQKLVSSPKKRKMVGVEYVMLDGIRHARPVFELV